LLVFLMAVSVPLGWFAWEMQRARRQREAVEALAKVGADVSYDYQQDEDPYVFREEPTAPAWLRRLLGSDFFCDVVVVFGSCRETDPSPCIKFDDKDAIHLKKLVKVNWLDLGSSQVTDAGLEHLRGLTELRELILNFTQVTDAGLEHLKGLTNLEALWLGNTQVTDAGLEHLKGLPNLDHLGLSNTQVTDAGLEHLKTLTNLERLELEHTDVTGEGMTRLQQALPNCSIMHECLHASGGGLKTLLDHYKYYTEAIRPWNDADFYNEAIRLDPKDADAHDSLARLLATCPDEKHRDGKKAVEHATKACELTDQKDHYYIETLAAAYAEAGDFGEAVKWQEKASSMCSEDEKEDFKARLDLYKSGKPYHQEVN
jgi:hypothetical protein